MKQTVVSRNILAAEFNVLIAFRDRGLKVSTLMLDGEIYFKGRLDSLRQYLGQIYKVWRAYGTVEEYYYIREGEHPIDHSYVGCARYGGAAPLLRLYSTVCSDKFLVEFSEFIFRHHTGYGLGGSLYDLHTL